MDARSLFVGFSFVFFANAGCGNWGEYKTDDDEFRSDVIDCEEATAHIQECCPSVQSLPDCHFAELECGTILGTWSDLGNEDHPISPSQSAAINAQSCSDLVAIGTCTFKWPSNASTEDLDPESSCGN
jgi:hypothetical protein